MTINELVSWAPHICGLLGTFRVLKRNGTEFICVVLCRNGGISYNLSTPNTCHAVWFGHDVPTSVGDPDDNVWYMDESDAKTLRRELNTLNEIASEMEV